ncbi:serine/threonine protein kinase [Microbacterium sp. NPDC091313]
MPDSAHGGGHGLFDDRFHIVGLLGAGGTASVYEAEDVTSGDRVALKVLHSHLAADDALRVAFLREAARVADIRHPALCASCGSGTTHTGAVWSSWQLAPGRSLAEIVRERGPLPARETVAIAALVLEGLEALHAAGLVHRDVSPANIVVDLSADGRVRECRLVDFGLVDASGQTARGADVLRSEVGDAVVGNAFYASPEQLQGLPVTASGDLYAVAGVVYYALVGVSAFARGDIAQTVTAHLEDLPPTPSVRARHVPPALDRAVVRGLMKQPAARYENAGAMRDALQDAVRTARGAVDADDRRTRVLGATGPAAREVALGEPVLDAAPDQPRATSPWLWVLAAAAVALIVAVAAVALRPGPAPAEALAASPAAAATPSAAAPTTSATADPGASEPSAPTLIAVPSLAGMPTETAIAALSAAGLAVGAIGTIDGTAAGGTVLATAPVATALLAAGTAVDLTVASGANAVPAVAGLAEQEAVDRLRRGGFAAVVAREIRSGTPGSVAESSPVAGSRVPLGTTVTVVVVDAPEAPPTPSPRPSSSASAGPIP